RVLLEAGAPADGRINWWGKRSGRPSLIGHDATLLHFVAERGPAESARALLDRSAKVNARDAHGQTPLHIAARCGRADLVPLLVGRGADRNAKTRRGQTPLDLAVAGRAGKAVLDLLRPSRKQ